MAKTYRLLGRVGVRKGFYRGAVADGDGQGRHPDPPTAADADHTWRNGLMTTATSRLHGARARGRPRAPTAG